MIDSLYIGATGMHAQQTAIDVTANNLTNANTTAFKKSRVDFADLLYRDLSRVSDSALAPTGVSRLGVGTAVTSVEKIFTAGDTKKTDGPLDVAIQGQGFFEVVLPDGSLGYSRSGAFRLNAEGLMTTAEGYLLSDTIRVPIDAQAVVIDPNGKVSARMPNQARLLELGQIQLGQFANPSGLKAVGDNLYLKTPDSGEVSRSVPAENGLGTLAQGFLEASNVKLTEEMVNLVLAQRAYEINARVVQASDELLSIVNNMRR